ncbi:D-2-hydroxyacid dehydrogenase [Terrihabitans soli]|uniref:D-2-hydroxyacid dehydrogenase n=1 Tax=Terrihabitans soli TaxID=708113 RepID=A0A6S6QLL3_9HYPH|nr:FAD-binding oxidoreductase [Terrihabitans soli]BCJ90216.1 D-2-hydroxyacid dehydrogenase [Terrihabitans soli]
MAAPDFIARLAAICGKENVASGIDLSERRGLFHGNAAAFVKPGSTEEVSAVVRLAADLKMPIVPYGGNTGLVGGQTPEGLDNAIVISLARMDKVRALDPDGNTLIIDAGATLATARRAAESVDRLFPLSLASEESCTIGGNLATNAGGLAVLAYGSARDLVLGLEVVLADGRIWNGLRTLRKDNTGYDLKHVFTGSEGTLGIITAAALKLFARPRSVATVLAGVPSPDSALALFRRARTEAGPDVTAAELIPCFGIGLAAKKLGVPLPLKAQHDWYVLLELSSVSASGLDDILFRIVNGARVDGDIADSVTAGSPEAREKLWAYREIMSDAQGLAGASIKHDVAVPVKDVPAFIRAATKAALAAVPGCRPCPFGHLGDGNIHFNVTQPESMDAESFIARWDAMNAAVHEVVKSFNGSIAAEHGIGRLKRDLLPGIKSETELDLMRALKTALDPDNQLNPGVLLHKR